MALISREKPHLPKEVNVSSEWLSSTTIQVKTQRREELIQLQLKLQASEEKRIDLRDVVDRVLVAGMDALNAPVPSNGVVV
jgi:hypothetical protein